MSMSMGMSTGMNSLLTGPGWLAGELVIPLCRVCFGFETVAWNLLYCTVLYCYAQLCTGG